jgi:hypothetical protein
VASSLNNLALLYDNQGQYAKAESQQSGEFTITNANTPRPSPFLSVRWRSLKKRWGRIIPT